VVGFYCDGGECNFSVVMWLCWWWWLFLCGDGCNSFSVVVVVVVR